MLVSANSAQARADTGHWTKADCTYQIPYRSLLPQRATNLLAAGRCISVDQRLRHATTESAAARFRT